MLPLDLFPNEPHPEESLPTSLPQISLATCIESG